jgi:hypothetical protein
MSLSIEGTRRCMLVTEAPLLQGIQGISPTLTQMDEVERIKLDEEQRGHESSIGRYRKTHEQGIRCWGTTTFIGISGVCVSTILSHFFENSNTGAAYTGLVDLKERVKKIDEFYQKTTDEVINARIGRLQSKIRLLEEALLTELQQVEKEQIKRGKDYFSMHLSQIMSERINKINVKVERVRNF